MPTGISGNTVIKITGGDKILSNMDKVKKDIPFGAFMELYKFCKSDVKPEVQRRASKGGEGTPLPLGTLVEPTGELADSIYVKRLPKKRIHVGSYASYAAAQELGFFFTKKMSKLLAMVRKAKGIQLTIHKGGSLTKEGLPPHPVQHPFLRPGVESMIPEMKEVLSNYCKEYKLKIK